MIAFKAMVMTVQIQTCTQEGALCPINHGAIQCDSAPIAEFAPPPPLIRHITSHGYIEMSFYELLL